MHGTIFSIGVHLVAAIGLIALFFGLLRINDDKQRCRLEHCREMIHILLLLAVVLSDCLEQAPTTVFH